jgi:DHA1 family inner membrane transport protein
VNGGVRAAFPFLPVIARGLGVPLGAVGALWGLKSFVGLAAPLVVAPSERHGRRVLMLAAMGTLVGACALLALSPGFALVAVGFVLLGLAKVVFDVPMQAWFGDRVPYAQRGRVLGATELTWSLSLLATVPLSGLLIPRIGWQAPFVIVGVLGIVGVVAVVRLIRSDRPSAHVRRPLELRRHHVAALSVALLFSAASELLFVVYGAWLEDDIGLTVAGIGLFTLVVVAAELAGEGLVTGLADRIGLRRSIFSGLLAGAVAYLALPAVGSRLLAAVAVVVLWFVSFEVTIVSTIPFVSELAAESRERLLGLLVAVIAAGRALGAVAAAPIYGIAGITSSALVAAVLTLAAAGLLLRVPSPRTPADLGAPGEALPPALP